MSTRTYRTVADTNALIDAVAAALPDWYSYAAFDGDPHARLLQAGTLRVSAEQAADVQAALAALTDTTAADAMATAVRADWRTAPLADALRAWGWAARTVNGHTLISGLWGDAVFPSNVAALLALIPHAIDDGIPWVFAADRDREPCFALTVNTRLTLHTQVDVTYLLD